MSENKQLSLIESIKPTEKSLWQMVQGYKSQLFKIASESMQKLSEEKKDEFLIKTIVSIVKNENLKDCFNSPEGRYSIFEVIRNCLRTGLKLDAHCYAVPQGRKIRRGKNEVWIKEARFDIRDRGYHSILVGGDKPIFKELKWDIVYSKDMEEFQKFNEILLKQNKEPKLFIDPETNNVNHIQSITEDRGSIVGVWVSCVHLDLKKESKFYPKKYLDGCRDKSPTWKKFKEGKFSTCVWNDYPEQMYTKTALKRFCAYWADVCEALQNAYYSEGDEIIETSKNVEDVAFEVLDNVSEKLDEELNTSENTVDNKNDSDIKQENSSLF